ncbi:hypothetical protein Aperf_G00000063975 [Anoplocephala perfoliata]
MASKSKDKGNKSGKEKGSKSGKGKGSKGSKGSKENGNKSKGACDAVPDPFVYERPPIPPPPPNPPKPTLLANMKRQVWYPYANRASLEYKERMWTPTYPLCTSWGEIWISQLPYRKIQRYKYDPTWSKFTPQGDPIITKGEPKIMVEVPLTGRIAVLLNCPAVKRNAIVFYDPETLQVEHKIEYPYKAEDPANIPSPVNPETMNPIARSFDLADESTPFGICANNTSICVIFDPLQKMQFLSYHKYEPQDIRLESHFSDENSCVHLASSGGCAMTDNMLFVAATRPNRIQAFYLHYYQVYDQVDLIRVILCANFGLDRFSFGEPFGVQIDSIGMLVANDTKTGVFHVYNVNKLPKGPCLPSLPNAEMCYMGSWKIDAYQHTHSGYFSLAKNGTAAVVDRLRNSLHLIFDQEVLRWYDDAYLYLQSRPNLEPQPVDWPKEKALCMCSFEDKWELIPPDQLLPESWVKEFQRDKNKLKEGENDDKLKASKASKKGKNSMASKTGKSKASKGSNGKKNKKT